MAVCAPEGLAIMQESAFGTPILTSSVVDYTLASTVVVPLPSSNAWSGDLILDQKTIPWGGGLDVVGDVVCDKVTVIKTLTTNATPALTALLLKAAVTRVNTAQTSPWTTTEPEFDQASIAAYHWIRARSGTVKREKYIGGKVTDLEFSCSRDSPILSLKATIQFQNLKGNSVDSSSDPDGTEFPLPADTTHPTGPYLFSHSSANFIRIATAVTSYSSLAISIKNHVDAQWFESKFVSELTSRGRAASLTADMLYKTSPDWRADYQALTTRAYSIKFDNGTNSFKIDFGNSNHVSGVPWELPLGKEFMQKATITNRWNGTAATDLALTIV